MARICRVDLEGVVAARGASYATAARGKVTGRLGGGGGFLRDAACCGLLLMMLMRVDDDTGPGLQAWEKSR